MMTNTLNISRIEDDEGLLIQTFDYDNNSNI
jgi:hypothetical protein